MTIHELDELQQYLKQKDTISNTEDYLKSLNISKTYAKLYLTTHLFVKFPDFFSDVSDEFKLIINKVYNNENLQNNLSQYEIMFNDWKQTNSIQLIDELQFMKSQTKAASSETEDNQCKYCYNLQEDIINLAESFFKEKYD